MLTVVIPSLNEGSYLLRTVDSLSATLPIDAELVVVDDGSTDGSVTALNGHDAVRVLRTDHVGVARARNHGAKHARGDIIVFADAHVTAPPGWWEPVVAALADPAVGAVAPAVVDEGCPKHCGFGLAFEGPDLEIEWLERQGDAPYAVPILPGCLLAMRRDVFDSTGGFDEGLIRWGESDNELATRLWLLGYELRVLPQLEVTHLFRDLLPYRVEWNAILHNKLRLAFVHFTPPRIERVVNALRDRHGFASGLATAIAGDAAVRRVTLAARRVRDDDWLFERFGARW